MAGWPLGTLRQSTGCCIIRSVMAAKKKWTPDRLAELSELYVRMPLRLAAVTMGVSEGAAHAALHDAGVTKPFSAYIPLKPMPLTAEQLAYFAGMIDADGTVTVRRDGLKWKPQIAITNTSLVLMDWLAATLSGPGARVNLQRPATLVDGRPRQAVYAFKVLGLGWLPFFQALEPYLVIKRDRMALVIEWTELRRAQTRTEPLLPRHLVIVDTIRRLNTKSWTLLREQQSLIIQSSTSELTVASS